MKRSALQKKHLKQYLPHADEKAVVPKAPINGTAAITS
jgi:hypothetical protein